MDLQARRLSVSRGRKESSAFSHPWTSVLGSGLFFAMWCLACVPSSVESFAPRTTKPTMLFLRQLPMTVQSVSTRKSTQVFEQTVNSEGRRHIRSPLENLNLLQNNNAKSPVAPPGFIRRKFPNFPWSQVPNWLTYARCAAIPLLVWFYYQPHAHVTTSAVFVAASVTDYLDGYLARRWDCSSRFGAFLDPVADKLMVSTALILLSGRYGKWVALPASIILARELAVSALREWMAQIGARDTVKVGWQGKCKTAFTMVALAVLLLAPPLGDPQSPLLRFCLPTGLVGVYLATVLTITSGAVYFKAASPYLMEKPRSPSREASSL